MRKSASVAGSVLATALLLGACGNDENNTDNDTTGTEDTATEPGTVTDGSSDNNTSSGTDDSSDNDTSSGTDDSSDNDTSSDTSDSSATDSSTNSDSDQDYMKEKMDKLSYDEFELEVDYGKDTEYEIEIEHDNGRVEATVEDELSNVDLKGREAFDEIYPKLEKLDITEATSKEQAIQQTLDAFELKDDYVKFELEITMPDGKKVEYSDRK